MFKEAQQGDSHTRFGNLDQDPSVNLVCFLSVCNFNSYFFCKTSCCTVTTEKTDAYQKKRKKKKKMLLCGVPHYAFAFVTFCLFLSTAFVKTYSYKWVMELLLFCAITQVTHPFYVFAISKVT